ncbi:flippase-like domain-containing protein [Candidatus Saccharibacteria bacterium]|nr:MAG: flippase-like domain-containing protein [Candidatus Saccharibacteria bacterium]
MKRLSFRTWLSGISLLLIVVLLYVSRHEIARAWELASKVDVWVLLFVIPVVAIGYLAAGEMVFSYMRQKKLIDHVSIWTQMRISLELNFVNHVLPSGGVSGISYMNWRLGKLGVKTGKATMAQAIRYVVGFAAMITLLLLSVLIVTIDGTVNRWIIFMSSALVGVMIISTMLGMYLMKSVTRLSRFAHYVARGYNHIVKVLTLGRIPHAITAIAIQTFLEEMHEDFVELMRDRRILIKPYLWGLFFVVTEMAIFWIVFWSLGSPVNPAPILIAYGLATMAGLVVVTPGGAGAYEAIMVLVLAIAGMSQSEAIAGIVLTRAIILFVTVVIGYVFYQMALLKYGKQPKPGL